MSIADKVEAAIKAVCPINGVSIGRVNDKSTWRIDFKDEATQEQRQAAQAALDAFNPEAPSVVAVETIVSLEQASPFTHRALREFFIGFGAVNPQFQATLLYQRAKAVDDAIKVERAKL